MNYNRLRYFYEVAKIRNITRAAAELYVSQPALSKQISALESELGAPLFTRTNRNLILTSAGEYLLRECETIFAREADIEATMQEITQLYSQRLRIASMGTDLLYNMPAIIREMEARHPGLAVEYKRMNWGEVKRAVEQGDVDAGVITAYKSEANPFLRRTVILHASYAAIVPAGHRLAGEPFVTMEMLRGERLILVDKDEAEFPYDPYGSTLRFCRDAGFSPRIAATYPFVEMVLMNVQAGEGVAMLSTFAPMHQMEGLRLVEMRGLPPVTLDLIWNRRAANVSISAFAAVLKEFFSDR